MRARSLLALVGLAAAVAAALAAAPAPSQAHVARSPLAVSLELERKLVVAYLRYSVEAGDDARALREQFDRDADGRLDDAEQAALGGFLAERAVAAVAVRVNDAPLALAERGADRVVNVEPGAAARIAVTVRLDAAVTWQKGANRLAVAVELPDPRAVTPVGVRTGQKSKLTLADGFRGGDASKDAPVLGTVRSY